MFGSEDESEESILRAFSGEEGKKISQAMNLAKQLTSKIGYVISRISVITMKMSSILYIVYKRLTMPSYQFSYFQESNEHFEYVSTTWVTMQQLFLH